MLFVVAACSKGGVLAHLYRSQPNRFFGRCRHGNVRLVGGTVWSHSLPNGELPGVGGTRSVVFQEPDSDGLPCLQVPTEASATTCKGVASFTLRSCWAVWLRDN